MQEFKTKQDQAPKCLHTLLNGDFERRGFEFCLWYGTDEAMFTTNGVVSSQNFKFWAAENPKWVI